MILIVALIAIVLLSYMKFRLGRRRMYELAAKLPSLREYPLIGHALLFAGGSEEFLNVLDKLSSFSEQHDGLCSIWLGPLLYISLSKPTDVEIVLNSCLQKDNLYKFMKPWVGNGTGTAPVSIWKHRRRMLTPTFNQRILDGFIDVFWEQGNILMEKIRPQVSGSTFDIFTFISACTLDIVCETTMGVKINNQKNLDTPYLRATCSQMDITYNRIVKIWLHPEFIFNLTSYRKKQDQNIEILHGFTNSVISKKRHHYNNRDKCGSLEPGKTTRKAFLDLMMDLTDQGQKLTDVELREEVDSVTLAGHHSTASAISFALVMIGSHPLVQEKVVAELNDIFGGTKRGVAKEDLGKMDYLDRVIKETLRLYPVLPFLGRQTEKEIKLTSATIPAGSGFIISVWALHRDKSVWGDDAHEFDPDRFLPERSAGRHPSSYIPFSYGMRNCIGRQYAMMSMKILLSTFIRNYKIKSDPHIPLKVELLLTTKHGHCVSIEER